MIQRRVSKQARIRERITTLITKLLLNIKTLTKKIKLEIICIFDLPFAYMKSALILTAIPTEYKSVRNYLTNLCEVETSEGIIFEKGKFQISNDEVDIYIGQCGMGNVNAALYTQKALSFLNPSTVFFVGIAGGIKDVSLGDVVIANKVYSYESAKDTNGYKARPDGHKCTYNIIQRATHEATINKWCSSVTDKAFNVIIGPVCTGEKVMSDKSSDLFHFIKDHYNDTIAIEMEGKGFLEALYCNRFDSFAIIRGISDLIENKSETDKNGNQEIASEHAAHFAFSLLPKIWPNIIEKSRPEMGIKITFPKKMNQDEIDSLLTKIKMLAQDDKIELEAVTYGSTNLYLKVSEKTYRKIIELQEKEIFEKELKNHPITIKEYFPSLIDFSISQELNRVHSLSEVDLKQIYQNIYNKNNRVFFDFLDIRDPNEGINCAITLKRDNNFDFFSSKRISLVSQLKNSRNFDRKKRSPSLNIFDYVICENNKHSPGSNIMPENYRSFKDFFNKQEIAIFKCKFNIINTVEASNTMDLINVVGITALTSSVLSSFIFEKKPSNKAQFTYLETYVVINNNNRNSAIINAERVIINNLFEDE